MKRTTSQCRSLSSGMPFARAIASAIVSFHCSGSTRKPSASMSTGASAIRVMVIVGPPCSGVDGFALLAGCGHGRPDARDLAARQECMPVDPLEGELAEVVEPRLAQERQPEGGGEVARQRFGLVVEVDQQCLVEAGLDEAVGVAVVAALELPVGEVAGDVLAQHLGLEVGDRAGLGGGQ